MARFGQLRTENYLENDTYFYVKTMDAKERKKRREGERTERANATQVSSSAYFHRIHPLSRPMEFR